MKFQNKEAYQFLEYKNEQGRIITVWNSGDFPAPYRIADPEGGPKLEYIGFDGKRQDPHRTPEAGEVILTVITPQMAIDIGRLVMEENYHAFAASPMCRGMNKDEAAGYYAATLVSQQQLVTLIVDDDWLECLQEMKKAINENLN